MDYEMNLAKYEAFVRSEKRPMIDHALLAAETEFLALSNALGGECGELQNVVKKIVSKNKFYGDTDLHEKFQDEAGDTLWYLVRLIQKSGYNVTDIMNRNIAKLTKRYEGVDTWRK